MKRSTLVTGLVVWVAGSLLAGPETIVRERAKELRDQHNVRQGIPPPVPRPAAPAAGASAGSATTLTPQQQSIARLRADFAAIKARSRPASELKQQLARNLMAAAQGATKPTSESVGKLAEDLTRLLADKPLEMAEQTRLAQDLHALFNSAPLSPTQVTTLVSDVQAILQVSGVPRVQAVALADQLKGIAGELRR